MAQYIDKDALLAEIEKLERDLYPDFYEYNYDAAKVELLEKIKNFINTLEVKEVDLGEEIEEQCKKVHQLAVGKELRDFAKYFFEIGLEAQHDNWKVVDNTNLPQGDRTKIYCVFTKDRYILATVINHPKDEELLQWKCTEFPHHRYDMCEGDKYMQIA